MKLSIRFARWPGIAMLALISSSAMAQVAQTGPSLQELRARTFEFRRLAMASDSAPASSSSAQGNPLAVAEDLYRRGDYAQASEQLGSLITDKRQMRDPAVIDLYLRIQLARGRNAEAADWVLRQQSATSHTPYIRFNLAVALMRSGREQEAVTALFRIGTSTAKDAESFALRDRANLALGWHFLDRGLGLNAKEAFQRVRLHGPHANRALLGMGWSELAPQDARAYRAYVGDEASAFNAREFSPSLSASGVGRRSAETDLNYLNESATLPDYADEKLSPAERLALTSALRVWRELQQRDRTDPFVWEAWIAVPYALEKAAIYDEATENYRQALARLDALESSTNTNAARVTELTRDSLAVIQQQFLSNSPVFMLPVLTDELPWTEVWLTGNATQVILEDIVEARRSVAEIATLESAIQTDSADSGSGPSAAALRRSWLVFAAGREREFTRLLSVQFELRQQLLRRYRQSAHFALAKLLDQGTIRPPPGPTAQQTFWERLNLFGKEPPR